MPIYEYSCGDCGEDFEAIQKFSDSPLKVCVCGKKGKVTRKVSLSAFHLQGGGWYKDRYGSKSKEKDNNGKKAEDGSKEKKDAKGKEGADSKKSGDSKTPEAGKDKKSSPSSPATT